MCSFQTHMTAAWLSNCVTVFCERHAPPKTRRGTKT